MMGAVPSPTTGLRLTVRFRRVVGAVWLGALAVFLPIQTVVWLATRATRSNLPAGRLPLGDDALILVELLRPVAPVLGVSILGGLVALWAWSVMWHAGVVRWRSVAGAAPVRAAEVLAHGLVWWWRYARLAVISAVGTALLLAAVWLPLRVAFLAAETSGEGGRAVILLRITITAALIILGLGWAAFLRGAWLLGEPGRSSAVVAWLRGLGGSLRRPLRSASTLIVWVVPGIAFLALPLLTNTWLAELRSAGLGGMIFLVAIFGAAWCWVGLFLSFAPRER
jgi:hypothetical protein